MGELRAAGFHPVGIGDNVPAEFTPLRDRIALDTSHLLLTRSHLQLERRHLDFRG